MPDVTAWSSFRLSHRLARYLVAALSASALTVGCQVGTRSPRSPSVDSTKQATRALPMLALAAAAGAPLVRTDGAVADLADAGVGSAPTDAAVAAAPPSLLAGPVPLGRGDPQRSGRSPYRLGATQPKEQWRVCTGGSIASAPTVAGDGTVLFSSHDRHVYAVTGGGTLRWKHRTGDMIWSAAALLSRGGAGASGPSGPNDEALVLVGSDDDKLHALRLADGGVAWQLSPGGCKRPTGRGPEAARCDIEDVTLSERGVVYFAGAAIYAASAEGKILWSFTPESPPDKKPHCSSAPALAPDGSLRAVCQDKLYALGPDGSKRWQIEGPGEFDSAPAIAPDGTAYIGDEARRLLAVDAMGQQRFSFISGGPVRAAPALRSDGSVVFGAYDGVLYALRPDGSLAWSFATADSIQSAPLVDADGAVVFGSRDNRVYALNPDGTLRWSLVLEEDIDGPPAIGPDGTLYIGSDDRCLHAFK